MTTRPLYLHIGTRKSGTTSLQVSLRASRLALLREGVNHPFKSRPQHMRMVLAPMLALGTGDGEQGREGIRELVHTLRDAPGDRLLLTLEDLAQMPEEPAGHLLEALSTDFDVHVVVTARDWSKQIPSEWQQLVKSRVTLPYDEFATAVREQRADVELFRLRQHLPGIARRWSQGLPPEQLHVIAVPSPEDPMGLYRLFAGLVGYDPLVLEISVGSRNASLGYEQAELLRQVNVALGDRLTDLRGQYRPVVRRLLINADGPLRKREGLSLGLPTGHVEWVRAESMAMLEELRAAGHHILGDPDDLMPPESVRTMDVAVDSDIIAQEAVQTLADVVVNDSQSDARPVRRGRRSGGRSRSRGQRRQRRTPRRRPHRPAGPARRAVRAARRIAGKVRRRIRR